MTVLHKNKIWLMLVFWQTLVFVFCFYDFVRFLHKTTWREYFDTLSFLSCERWLCAPFFSSFSFCFDIIKLCFRQPKNSSPIIAVFPYYYLFWLVFWLLFFLHKTTWREYFDALSFLSCERWLCAPFFSSSFQKIAPLTKTLHNFKKQLLPTSCFFCGFLFLLWGQKKTWREYFAH